MPHALVAVASRSKKPVNQDAARIAVNPRHSLAAVVVADGIGSHYGAETASAIVASSIAEDLSALASDQRLDMKQLFLDAQRMLRARVDDMKETLPANLDWDNAFGTTAISAVETPDAITLAYSGNGGIFHIRGNFNTFDSSHLLPWTSLNYLNPHSVSVFGKNAMYKLLAPRSNEDEIVPSVITIAKDDSWFGDIIMCCTDGIYSYDQTPIGRDDSQHIWISGEASMALFYENLRTFFAGERTAGALQATLDTYLDRLDSEGLISDDCTVGVLITERVIQFQAELPDKRETVTA